MDKILVEFDLNREYENKFVNHNVSIDILKEAFLENYKNLSETGCFLLYMPSSYNNISEALLCNLTHAIGKAKIIKEENNVFTLEVNHTLVRSEI